MKLLTAAILGLALSSCMTLADFHEARVLEDGESQLIGSSGIGSSDDFFGPSLMVDGSLAYRYGISNKSEFNFRISLNGAARVGMKYQFLGDQTSNFAMSSGFSAEGMTLADSALSPLILRFPLYTSFHPNDWIAFYGSAQYAHRLGEGFQGRGLNFLQINSGVRLGRRYGVLFEANYIPKLMRSDIRPVYLYGQQQYHAGLFFKF